MFVCAPCASTLHKLLQVCAPSAPAKSCLPADPPIVAAHLCCSTARGRSGRGRALLMLLPEELSFLKYLKVRGVGWEAGMAAGAGWMPGQFQRCIGSRPGRMWHAVPPRGCAHHLASHPPPPPCAPPAAAGRQGSAERVRVPHLQAVQRAEPAGEAGGEELLPAPVGQGGLQVRGSHLRCTALSAGWRRT